MIGTLRSKRLLRLTWITILSPGASLAASLPPELLWQGKPVEPYCFEKLVGVETSSDTVDLNNCSAHEDIAIKASDLPLKEPDYKYAYSPKEDMGGQGYYESISYRYIGMVRGHPLVLTDWSGGGSGNFSAAIELRREQNALHVVKYFSGGDRCNGGISDVKIENGAVIVDNAITPGDFLGLFPGMNPHGLRPYDDLDSAALSCIGTIRKTDGVVTAFIPDTADTEKPKHQKYVEQDNYESCFEHLMGGVPSNKPWTVAQIKEFMHHFNRSCVEKTAS